MKRKGKKVLGVILAASLLLGGATAVRAEALQETEKYKVGLLISDPSEGFWKEVLESIQEACSEREFELTYQIVDDSSQMRTAFDSLVSQEVDIILDGYSVEEVAAAYCQEAVDIGMPMLTIAFDSGVEGVYGFGTSNSGMAEMFGEAAVKEIEKRWAGEVDLIILANAYTAVPAMASRTDEALPIIYEAYPELEEAEVVKLDMENDVTSIYKKTMDTITSHPDAEQVLYIAPTDSFVSYALSAIEQCGKEDNFIIFSSDNTETAQAYFRETKELGKERPWVGSLDLQTATYGYLVIDKAVRILEGTEEEFYTEHYPTMVTAENIDEIHPKQ